jgi:hypothetical protein
MQDLVLKQFNCMKSNDLCCEQLFKETINEIVYERHVYSGPLGDGYTLVATKLVDGKKFIATEHYGPEARVDSGGLFIEVVEEVI